VEYGNAFVFPETSSEVITHDKASLESVKRKENCEKRKQSQKMSLPPGIEPGSRAMPTGDKLTY
jgi:hypothetical protein